MELLISRWGFALRLQLLLFLNKEQQNTIMGWKWSSEHQVWVNFNRPVTFDSGSLSGADLNECSDPHYPLKDMLIATAFTALPNTGFSKPALQHARKPKKIYVTADAPILWISAGGIPDSQLYCAAAAPDVRRDLTRNKGSSNHWQVTPSHQSGLTPAYSSHVAGTATDQVYICELTLMPWFLQSLPSPLEDSDTAELWI